MKFSTLSIAASMAACSAPVIAQTPPGYSPATTNTFSVKFGNSVVTPGGSVKLQDTVASPSIDFNNLPGDAAHFLAMLDLDAPKGDIDRSYSPLLHWMAFIPAGKHSSNAVTDVAPYSGPQPPAGFGAHRYVLLLLTDPSNEFHMPPGFENQTYSDINSRVVFPTEKFIAAGKFKVAAANWFTTENTTATTTTPPNATKGNNSTVVKTSAPASAGASTLQVSAITGIVTLMSLLVI